ncbi:MAG: aldo/keto reductase [Fidelibacterota bacterium]|nr:MAG: aldo/keto reductase [Candidatus Neomarinimicrobiota bacterium]
MIYRTLGRTELSVSILGFGASPLGHEFGAINETEGIRAVQLAIEKGINYFDVSPYYGRTMAEERLGAALDGKRQQIVLASKTGRYDKDQFDFSAERVVTSLEESLKRLRTDYLDVFQAHDIEFGNKAQIIGETVPTLIKMKEQGKVRFVGVTGYQLNPLRDLAENTDIDMVLSYCRYNLMDTALDRVLMPALRRRGIGLVNASPLHMRLLTARGAPDWHPAPEAVLEAGRRATDWCNRQGADISELALQFALDYASAATTLVGMGKVSHVERNVKAVGIKPDAELLRGVQEIIKPVADTCWTSDCPENNDPEAVPARV